MSMMELRPLSAHIGAEIVNADLNALNDSDVETLRQGLADHGVLFAQNQSLTPEQHIAFAKRWGPIDLNNYFPVDGEYPEIAEVKKSETQETNIGGGWHTDHSYDQIPAMGSILLARETPPTGGDTLFSSLTAAFDSLSEGMKATLRTMKAVHSADHIYATDGIYSKTDQADLLRGHDLRTRAVHPVVIRHPVTGREILYVNPAFTLHFEGWTRDESMALLQYLYQIPQNEAFQCRLQWAPGSIAIWDNRSTWHYALNDYHGHRRLMHRITLSGCALH